MSYIYIPEKEQKQVAEYVSQIKLGLEYRKKFSSEEHWEKYRSYYRGDWGSDLVPVNTVFSFIRGLVPKVYFRNPGVAVTALRPDMIGHAKLMEKLDNNLIVETNLKYQLKRVIVDAFLCGTGIIKVGYDSEYGYDPSLAATPGESGETGTQFGRKDGDRIEYSAYAKPGMPWAMRVAPEMIITPWGYDDAKSLPWIGNIIYRPLEDVKDDQKYNRQRVGELTGTHNEPLVKGAIASTAKQRYAKLVEIRDYKTGMLVTLCEGKMLLSVEDALQIEGLPYKFLTFNPDPDHLWGISDVKIMEPQVKELNEIRTQASRHRRVALLKLIIKKGILGNSEEQGGLEKLLNDKIKEVIEVDSDSIAQDVMLLQPHIPSDLSSEAAMVQGDLRSEVGFGRNQQSELTSRTPPSAMEANLVQQAFEVRVDERRDAVADLISSIVGTFNQLIFKYWDKKKIEEISGPGGSKHWVEYTGQQLKGEYFLRVDPESGMPISRGARQQMLEAMFDKFNQDPYIDQVKLRELVLRQADWLDSTILDIIKPPEMDPNMMGAPGGNGGGPAPQQGPQPLEDFAKQMMQQGGGREPQ